MGTDRPRFDLEHRQCYFLPSHHRNLNHPSVRQPHYHLCYLIRGRRQNLSILSRLSASIPILQHWFKLVGDHFRSLDYQCPSGSLDTRPPPRGRFFCIRTKRPKKPQTYLSVPTKTVTEFVSLFTIGRLLGVSSRLYAICQPISVRLSRGLVPSFRSH